jgi:hypothetical protein
MKSKCFMFLLLFASSFVSNSYAGQEEIKLCYATAIVISVKANILGDLELEKQYKDITLSLDQLYRSRYGNNTSTSNYLANEAVTLAKNGLNKLPDSNLLDIINGCAREIKQGTI